MLCIETAPVDVVGFNTVHSRRHPEPNDGLSERGIEWFLP
jgi:hypothetical protein